MSVSVSLPPSTSVYVSAFTNAAYIQRITITPPAGGGSTIIWQGSGEGEHPIGTTSITTPASTASVNYDVLCEYSSDGGSTWSASTMIPGGCVVGSMNTRVVISEDHVDQDFNDAVVQFLWWESLS